MLRGLSRDGVDFDRARHKALWNELLAFLTGHPKRLLSWEEVSKKLDVRDPTYLGVQSVPLDNIVGSVGRSRDFDRKFNPIKEVLASRWRAIYRAHDAGRGLPPVELFKVGDAYFVLDGHHRVSVAREKKIGFIDAQVVESQARVPVTERLDANELEVKEAYVRFLRHTQLDELRPDQHIEFTIRDGYEQLLEHIATHRDAMSHERQGSVPKAEAVCDWYDRLYYPVVQIVRENEILADFPRRTEADLYLWIVGHRHRLQEQCGPDVIPELVAQHFADRYTTRPIKRLVSTLRAAASEPACALVTASTPDAVAARETNPPDQASVST